MKRWLGLAALLALLFALPAAARVDFDYDSIDPAVKVHDLAGLLSDGEEARLLRIGVPPSVICPFSSAAKYEIPVPSAPPKFWLKNPTLPSASA